ncbi:hypothetical protein BST61_g2076 [Cercospora zeina]
MLCESHPGLPLEYMFQRQQLRATHIRLKIPAMIACSETQFQRAMFACRDWACCRTARAAPVQQCLGLTLDHASPAAVWSISRLIPAPCRMGSSLSG